jgi:hypothetical protein
MQVVAGPCEVSQTTLVGQADYLHITSTVTSNVVGSQIKPVEIDSIVADGAQSLIREQVEMGVAVRMAVLEALARNLPNA